MTQFTDPVVQSLQNQGYKATYLPGTNVVVVSRQKKEAYFIDGYTPLVPYNLGIILSNKQIIKHILHDAQIPVSDTVSCPPDNLHELRKKIAESQLRYPLFIRQENSQLPVSAIGPLANLQELEAAYISLSTAKQLLMIEPYVEGVELRVFISSTGFINILRKRKNRSEQVFVAEQISDAERPKYQDVTNSSNNQSIYLVAKKLLTIFQPMPYISFSVIQSPKQTQQHIVTEVYHSAKPHYSYAAYRNKKSISVLDFITNQIVANCFSDAASKTSNMV